MSARTLQCRRASPLQTGEIPEYTAIAPWWVRCRRSGSTSSVDSAESVAALQVNGKASESMILAQAITHDALSRSISRELRHLRGGVGGDSRRVGSRYGIRF